MSSCFENKWLPTWVRRGLDGNPKNPEWSGNYECCTPVYNVPGLYGVPYTQNPCTKTEEGDWPIFISMAGSTRSRIHYSNICPLPGSSSSSRRRH